jgi:hypothetical protein
MGKHKSTSEKTAKTNGNGANLGFEAKLWLAADKIRNNMDVAEYNQLLAEYSFAGIDKPIGISTYKLSRALPKNLQSALPTVEEIEAELSHPVPPVPSPRKKRPAQKKKGGGS